MFSEDDVQGVQWLNCQAYHLVRDTKNNIYVYKKYKAERKNIKELEKIYIDHPGKV